MTTSTVAPQVGGPPKDARKALEDWGVIIRDGHEKWNDEQLAKLHSTFSMIPDTYRTLLKDLVVVLDTKGDKPNDAAFTHPPGFKKCTVEPLGKVHVHFCSRVFTDLFRMDWPWRVKSSVRAPLHELGHVLVARRRGPQVLPDVKKEGQELFKALQADLPSQMLKDAMRAYAAFRKASAAVDASGYMPEGVFLPEIIAMRTNRRDSALPFLLALKLELTTLQETFRDWLKTHVGDPMLSTVRNFCTTMAVGLQALDNGLKAEQMLTVFAEKSQEEGYQPFNGYGKTDLEEFFAETYTMFIVKPDKLPNSDPAYLQNWFVQGCPTTS